MYFIITTLIIIVSHCVYHLETIYIHVSARQKYCTMAGSRAPLPNLSSRWQLRSRHGGRIYTTETGRRSRARLPPPPPESWSLGISWSTDGEKRQWLFGDRHGRYRERPRQASLFTGPSSPEVPPHCSWLQRNTPTPFQRVPLLGSS